MKPDYYIHSHTREFVATTREGDDYTHEKVSRTQGEHVMTLRMFKSLSVDRVGTMIGGLAKMRRPKGKKARKAQ